MKRFCQLYGVNSESKSIRIKLEANYEPKITLYEFLDECPSDLSSSDDGYLNNDDIMEKISPELKSVIRNIPGKQRNDHFGTKEIDLTVTDEIHTPPDFEKLTDFGSIGVSSGSSFSSPPQYPFSSSSSQKEASFHSKSAPDRLHPERDPIPIQPVSVSHAGGGGGGRFGQSQASQFPCFSQNCRYQTPQFSQQQSYPSQSFQSQTYPTQPFLPPRPPPLPYQQPRSSYPCPAARRGDPCAPKPRCGPAPLPPCESYATVEKITTELPKPYWSEWSPAGTCSVTCGSGIRQRKRFCSTGRESDCRGDATLEESCELPECDIWSEWGSYTPCTVSCGGGEQERSRYCKNGRNCIGPAEERRTCADVDCPHWSGWSGWHECSASCGQGMAKRSRDCLPIGSYDCPGEAQEHQSCELRPCPEWAPWLQWTECTKSCDGGERQRRRECLHGSTNECPGPAEEHILCNQQSCPEWSQWTFWSQCSATCGDDGTRLRNRQCQFEGFPSNLCMGTAQDQSACQLEECPYWGDWTSWSSCTASCGHGQQTRSRKCQPKSYGCQGGDREMRFCQNSVCPYWDQWGEWGMSFFQIQLMMMNDTIFNLTEKL
uniref:Uncharacterized protein n=1 Tax=Panagrolaimus superbus TaxID=310955 RepID=A0A914ZG89_9BILA